MATTLPETYRVRFANRTAVQRFREAMDLVTEALQNAPWCDELRAAQQCLDEAWDGLSFGIAKE